MTKLARKTLNLNAYDNTTLTRDNLDSICVQRNQNFEKEQTIWIFEDGSALVQCTDNEWLVNSNYGLHCDNEQLN